MVKRILWLVMIATAFAGCATDSDPDRLSWEDAKNQMTSVFGQDNSSMSQAAGQMQGLSEDPNQKNQDSFKY